MESHRFKIPSYNTMENKQSSENLVRSTTKNKFKNPKGQYHQIEVNSKCIEQQLTLDMSKPQSERLSDLHTKLRQEADNIRRFKVQTELELNQKDAKLQDANETIEHLKSELLQVTMKREILIHNIQETVNKSEEVQQMNDGTREMIEALKDYADGIEDKIKEFEVTGVELKERENEQLEKVEKLAGAFQKLELETSEKVEQLKLEAQSKSAEKEEIEKSFKEHYEQSTSKIEMLTNECEEKEVQINDMSQTIIDMQQSMNAIEFENNDLREKYSACETVSEAFKVKLEEACGELKELQEVNSMQAEKLESERYKVGEISAAKEILCKNFDETDKARLEKIEELNNQVDKLKGSIADLISKEDELKSSIEDLKNKIDEAQIEKSNMSKQLMELEIQKKELEKEREKSEKLIISNDELECKNAILVNCIKEKEAEISSLTVKLNESYNQEKDAVSKNLKLTSDLDDLKAEKNNIEVEMQRKEEEMKKLIKDNEQLNEKEKKLKSKLEDAQKSIDSLRVQFEDAENQFRVDLVEMEKKLEIESKNALVAEESKKKNTESDKALKAELMSKNKEIEALREEVKSIQSEICVTKSDKEVAEKLHETQMMQMVDTLEVYKKENSKCVEQKEKSIEVLNKKIADFQNSNKKDALECKSLKQEIKTLKQQLKQGNNTYTKAEKDIIKIKDELEKKVSQLKAAEETIKKQEEEKTSLTGNLEAKTSEAMAYLEKQQHLEAQLTGMENSLLKKVNEWDSEKETLLSERNKIQNESKLHQEKVDSMTKECKYLHQKLEELETKHKNELTKNGEELEKQMAEIQAQRKEIQSLQDQLQSVMVEQATKVKDRAEESVKKAVEMTATRSAMKREVPITPRKTPNQMTAIKPMNNILAPKQTSTPMFGSKINTPVTGSTTKRRRYVINLDSKKLLSDSDSSSDAVDGIIPKAIKTPQSYLKTPSKRIFFRENKDKDSKAKHIARNAPNIRKTPSRNSGKFFKTPPKVRNRKIKKEKENGLDWLDSTGKDSDPFGFDE